MVSERLAKISVWLAKVFAHSTEFGLAQYHLVSSLINFVPKYTVKALVLSNSVYCFSSSKLTFIFQIAIEYS